MTVNDFGLILRTNVRKILTPKHFFPLAVSDIRRLTQDSVEISLDVTPELKSTFAYQPGQYVTVHSMIDGESVRRSYSICSAPSSGKLRIGVKQVENGKFSTFANQILKKGDTLDVMAPMGHFTLSDPSSCRHILYISAGSGITPIMSHVTEYLAKVSDVHISLIYANRNTDAIMFKNDIETLKDRNLRRLSVYHVFSREKIGIPILQGRLDQDRCTKIVKGMIPLSDIDQVFICGPAEMIMSAKSACEGLDIATDKIHFELFTTEGLPQQISSTPTYQEAVDYDPETFSKITVKIDGEILTFPLAYGGQNILDAALENGADLPFACKGGVCSTCKAKVTSGEVMMTMNYALEADEIAAQYTLTCQAHPRTSDVFVDFDQK